MSKRVLGMVAMALSGSASAAAPEGQCLSGPFAVKRQDLQASLEAWLAAFNNLDLDCFLTFWAPDASVFPIGPKPPPAGARRVEPETIREHWTRNFEATRRASPRSAPPYRSVAPRELRIDALGRDGAIVTFHLGDGPWPHRRTLVWRRDAGGWRVVHLHASRIPEPEPKQD